MMSAQRYQLEWVEDLDSPAPELKKRAVISVADLDEALDQVEGKGEPARPLIAVLVSPRGSSLGIGLGGPQSVLTFDSGSGMPPYFESVGDKAHRESGVVVFYAGGQWTEFPSGALIPKESARKAIRIFFETGERPNNVIWEEV